MSDGGTVGIIGAGTMGAGIAQVAVTSGWTVELMDVVKLDLGSQSQNSPVPVAAPKGALAAPEKEGDDVFMEDDKKRHDLDRQLLDQSASIKAAVFSAGRQDVPIPETTLNNWKQLYCLARDQGSSDTRTAYETLRAFVLHHRQLDIAEPIVLLDTDARTLLGINDAEMRAVQSAAAVRADRQVRGEK